MLRDSLTLTYLLTVLNRTGGFSLVIICVTTSSLSGRLKQTLEVNVYIEGIKQTIKALSN